MGLLDKAKQKINEAAKTKALQFVRESVLFANETEKINFICAMGPDFVCITDRRIIIQDGSIAISGISTGLFSVKKDKVSTVLMDSPAGAKLLQVYKVKVIGSGFEAGVNLSKDLAEETYKQLTMCLM